MHNLKTKLGIWFALLLIVAGVAFASLPVAWAGGDNRAPELPSPLCDSVQVPAGNRVAFRVYAQGVQVYSWNGASWDFMGPMAKLYASPNFRGEVGIHYVGPTWRSNNGGRVVATRETGCSPDPTAIPWLRLRATSTDGPGIFKSVTYIQRVNTTGGMAPTTPGSFIGEVVEVPYTAEYYFYRAED